MAKQEKKIIACPGCGETAQQEEDTFGRIHIWCVDGCGYESVDGCGYESVDGVIVDDDSDDYYDFLDTMDDDPEEWFDDDY